MQKTIVILSLIFLLCSCSAPTTPKPESSQLRETIVILASGEPITIDSVGCNWGNDNLFMWCYGKDDYHWYSAPGRWGREFDTGSVVFSGHAQSWFFK